jgi:ion channel-forming bestrophin family protein
MDPTTGRQISQIKSPHPLLPARNPPPISLDDWIPFYGLFHDIYSLCRGRARQLHKVARGKKDYHRRKRQPIQGQKDGDNVPLEITLLLSGWVAALQRRKSIDVPTINTLLAALQSFSDSLTGLERVL